MPKLKLFRCKFRTSLPEGGEKKEYHGNIENPMAEINWMKDPPVTREKETMLGNFNSDAQVVLAGGHGYYALRYLGVFDSGLSSLISISDEQRESLLRLSSMSGTPMISDSAVTKAP